MIRLLIPAIALLLMVWFFKSYKRGTPEQRKRLVLGFLFLILFSAVLFLTITGRLHYIAAIITGALPFLKKLAPYLRYVPFLKRFVGNIKAKNQAPSGAEQMTRAQALEVLGLQEGVGRDEIIEAHRKLMQKCHPDRGGNDYLAAQLNQAKDTLLG